MIICLTGMPGSGKTTVAEMLKKRGFTLVEMHDAVNLMMKEQHIELTMENRERFALDMRRDHGRDVFAVATAQRVKNMKGDVVVSGVRDSDEIACIKRVIGGEVFVVAITAPPDVRYKRILNTPESWVKAKDRDAFESREEKNKKMGVDKAINASDFIIANTGTMDELEANVRSVLERISNGGNGVHA